MNCGEEILFHLIWEKYCSVLFMLIFICNLPLMCVYKISANNTLATN